VELELALAGGGCELGGRRRERQANGPWTKSDAVYIEGLAVADGVVGQ
jgi:hypothetical protein